MRLRINQISSVLIKNGKLQLLATMPVSLGLLNTILLITFIGVGALADTYFAIISIITISNLIILMPIDQFINFIDNFKGKERNKYISTSLKLSIITGLLIYMVAILFFANFSSFIFSKEITESGAYKNSMIIGLIPIILSGPNYILKNITFFHGDIATSYILQSIQAFCTTITLWCGVLGVDISVKQLLLANTVGLILMFLGYGWKIKKYSFIKELFAEFDISLIRKMLITSVNVRLAGNIHTITLNSLFLYYLTHYGTGLLSIYGYCEKASNAIVAITHGPLQAKFIAEIATLTINGKQTFGEIYTLSKHYLIPSVGIFIPASLIAIAIFPGVVDLLSDTSIDLDQHMLITILCFMLAWRLITIIESVPIILIYRKKVLRPLYVINSFFAIFMVLTLYFNPLSSVYWSIFSILLIAQTVSLIQYYYALVVSYDIG